MNAKFATSSVVFDGAYGKIDEFLGDITEHVGLIKKDLPYLLLIKKDLPY